MRLCGARHILRPNFASFYILGYPSDAPDDVLGVF